MHPAKGRPRPRAGSSSACRCFPAPAKRGGSRGSPRRRCRAAAGPAGPADIPDRHPPPPDGHCTARRGIRPDNPPAPAAGQGHPGRRRWSAAPGRSTAVPSAAAPRCGRETAPGPRPGWTGRTAPAVPARRAPARPGWATGPVHPARPAAAPDIPVHKSRCAPGRQGSPRQPASGRRCPPCLPRPTVPPPAAACRASGCRRAGPRCASLRPDCGTAVRTAAPRSPAPVRWSNGP